MKAHWDAENDPLTALQGGNAGPFEAFIRLETTTLLGFFRRLGAPPDRAEDLTQELAIKLYSAAKTYTQQGRFSSYLFRAARNLWIDSCRRNRGLAGTSLGEELLASEPDKRAETPSASLERSDQRSALEAALAQLSESHRSVFELAILQDLPYEQIAEMLGIPKGTVKSRVFYALRKLRETLRSEQESSGGPK